MYVLEPLKDSDVETIVIQAIERYSRTLPAEAKEATPPPPTPESSQNKPGEDCSSPVVAFPRFPQITQKVLSTLVSLASGDARTALGLLELVLTSSPRNDWEEESLLDEMRRSVSVRYDRTGESHYDMISALHKSVRGSKPDAAMYWLARMLTAGEDPMVSIRICLIPLELLG